MKCLKLLLYTAAVRLLKRHRLPLAAWKWYFPDPVFQIAVYHIIFKVVTGVILLPLVNVVVKWTYRIIPKQAHESAFRFEYIDPNMVGSPAVLSLQVGREVERMCDMVRKNVSDAAEGLIQNDIMSANVIRERE